MEVSGSHWEPTTACVCGLRESLGVVGSHWESLGAVGVNFPTNSPGGHGGLTRDVGQHGQLAEVISNSHVGEHEGGALVRGWADGGGVHVERAIDDDVYFVSKLALAADDLMARAYFIVCQNRRKLEVSELIGQNLK